MYLYVVAIDPRLGRTVGLFFGEVGVRLFFGEVDALDRCIQRVDRGLGKLR
jgi:hypothetical protein